MAFCKICELFFCHYVIILHQKAIISLQIVKSTIIYEQNSVYTFARNVYKQYLCMQK